MKKFKISSFLASCFIVVLAVNMPYNHIHAEEKDTSKIYYLNDNGILNGTLFSSEDKLWPGRKIFKTFYIVNDNNFDCFIKNLSVEGKLKNKSGEALDVERNEFMRNIHISIFCEDNEVFNGVIGDLKYINLPYEISIDSYNKKKFTIEIFLDEASGNSDMDLKYTFNIQTNFTDFNGISKILVQTGYFIDDSLLLLSGTLLCALGVLIIFKKKSKFIM